MGVVDERPEGALGRWSACAVLGLTALLTLSACDDQPYPAAANTAAPPAPPPASDLMGAPAQPPPPPPAYSPPPPASSYDRGAVVAMNPIPNPGDPGSEPYYGHEERRRRIHARYEAGGAALASTTVHLRHHRAVKSASTAYAEAVRPAMAAPKPAASSSSAAPSAANTTKSAPAAAPPPAAKGDAVAVLQTALADDLRGAAVLSAPAKFQPGQPADVTLSVPASFADTIKSEAQKQGLADAAASVSLGAVLTGEGFTAVPADLQSALLTSGQPTQFHWTVTAAPGAHGPLQASVTATLLGGGSTLLNLGSVEKTPEAGFKLSPRVIGAGLLILFAILLSAWLFPGRRSARAAIARRGRRPSRPLDMTPDPTEPREL